MKTLVTVVAMMAASAVAMVYGGDKTAAPAGGIRLFAIENGTITLPADMRTKVEAVATPDGPRIKFAMGGVSLEATRIRVRSVDRLWTLELDNAGNLQTSSLAEPGAAATPSNPPPKK